MGIPRKNKKVVKSKKSKTESKGSTKKEKLEYPYIVIQPDRPDIWAKAGFGVEYKGSGKNKTGVAYIPKDKTNLHTLYKAEGESEFYSASFFGGEIHVQLIPIIQLPDFLEKQIQIDEAEGKWYDLITLKENGREAWGAASGFSNTNESAEDFLIYLTQYKQHGALIGEERLAYEYIQVCYIQLG